MNNLNINIFINLHNAALKMFQNILINLEETLDHHEIKQGNHFFLNEFISHMDNNNNSYHYKNVNEKETGNMKQGNESKIFGTNVSLTTSKKCNRTRRQANCSNK